MVDQKLTLKANELFLVGDLRREAATPAQVLTISGANAAGLYWRDTRYLSNLELSLDGVPLDEIPPRRPLGPTPATLVFTNMQPISRDGKLLRPRSIVLEQRFELDTGLHIRFILHNFSDHDVSFRSMLRMAADFRDLFIIRGVIPVDSRHDYLGQYLPLHRSPEAKPSRLVLQYNGLDKLQAKTVITIDQPATDIIEAPTTAAGIEATALFTTSLPHRSFWELNVSVTPKLEADTPTLATGSIKRSATISSNARAFNALLDTSAEDLALLDTHFPDGWIPAAGIPWFVAPFGRDSLITALQTLHLAPQRAAETLRVLARLQGTKEDRWRAEEPGKIPHERRYGELARHGTIPQTPYYGSVDATPLFALLFAETVAWTADHALYNDLLPNVRQALAWIEGPGDPDGDGLVEYQSRPPGAVSVLNQGWMDSPKALQHLDGRLPTGLVALVEVQGYVYAAYRRLADVVAAHGEASWAEELRERASAVQRKVEDAFWMEEERFYAQALDEDKSPFRTIASNPGHLLFCGLPSPERAAAVATRLQEPDLNSGWGIRTLSSNMPSFNPMGYHIGSIWPHDNSLIVAGLRRYGHDEAAKEIAEALFAAGETDPLSRLPELYSGFARKSVAAEHAPVRNLMSCSPQSWAAGAVPLLVRTLLGLEIDLARGRLLVTPSFPERLKKIEIVDMEVLGAKAAISVLRDLDTLDGYRIDAMGPVARVIK